MNSTVNHHKRRRRLLFLFAAILLIAVGVTAWILKTNEIISDLGAIFTILGVLLAFLHEDFSPADSTSTLSIDPVIDKQSLTDNCIGIEGITPEILGLTKGRGALIVYTNSYQLDSPIGLTFGFHKSCTRSDIVEHVVKRKKCGRTVFVSIFRDLPRGSYTVKSDMLGLEAQVTIEAGDVKEVNWRGRAHIQVKHSLSSDIN